MTTYKIELVNNVLQIGFVPENPANNDRLVRDAYSALETVKPNLQGIPLLKVNGAASLPVAMMLAKGLAPLVGAIACFDPKLKQYVVCITHNPDYQLGQLVD